MAEGYAGTLQVLDATNNFWGWTAVAREIVRDDQWQEMVDVYVRDKHQLGLAEWFEQHNPHALAQTIERMVEAARQGYWRADEKTLAELKTRWRELAARHDVRSDNARFAEFVQLADQPADAASGFGLQAASAVPAARSGAEPPPEAQAPDAETAVSGLRMERQEAKPTPSEPATPADTLARMLAVLVLVVLMLLGAAMQARRGTLGASGLRPRAA
jgi:cobaltochelatase CobN